MGEKINLNNPIHFYNELEPIACTLLNRHLGATKEWFPHELIPFDQGRTFGKNYTWSPEDSEIKDVATASALYVNLLTEDNLPYYFRDIERMFGKDGSFGEWGLRRTAEEGRHSDVIREYLHVTRAIDPKNLERGRMAQVSGGETPQPDSALVGCLYVSLQELATRIAHRNTGQRMPDAPGKEIMKRVGNDENLHYLFYKDIAKTAFSIDPSSTLIALQQVVHNFAMPGTGIPGFKGHSERIALSGIYGTSEFIHEVVHPVIDKQWNIWNIENINPEAENARIKLNRRMKALGKIASTEQVMRENYKAELIA